jgi:hypothetical protein
LNSTTSTPISETPMPITCGRVICSRYIAKVAIGMRIGTAELITSALIAEVLLTP